MLTEGITKGSHQREYVTGTLCQSSGGPIAFASVTYLFIYFFYLFFLLRKIYQFPGRLMNKNIDGKDRKNVCLHYLSNLFWRKFEQEKCWSSGRKYKCYPEFLSELFDKKELSTSFQKWSFWFLEILHLYQVLKRLQRLPLYLPTAVDSCARRAPIS